MKYVIIHKKMGQGMVQVIPIVFPNAMVHADMAEAAMKAIGGECTVKSAGEAYINCTSAHGESSTLGIKSNPDERDHARINLSDYVGIEEEE